MTTKLRKELTALLKDNTTLQLNVEKDRITLINAILATVIPSPIFSLGDEVFYHGTKCTVFNVKNYCNTCNNYMQIPVYSIKTADGAVYFDIKESSLTVQLDDD